MTTGAVSVVRDTSVPASGIALPPSQAWRRVASQCYSATSSAPAAPRRSKPSHVENCRGISTPLATQRSPSPSTNASKNGPRPATTTRSARTIFHRADRHLHQTCRRCPGASVRSSRHRGLIWRGGAAAALTTWNSGRQPVALRPRGSRVCGPHGRLATGSEATGSQHHRGESDAAKRRRLALGDVSQVRARSLPAFADRVRAAQRGSDRRTAGRPSTACRGSSAPPGRAPAVAFLEPTVDAETGRALPPGFAQVLLPERGRCRA